MLHLDPWQTLQSGVVRLAAKQTCQKGQCILGWKRNKGRQQSGMKYSFDVQKMKHVYLNASKLKLKHVAGCRLDKDSRKQLCAGFHLVGVETILNFS